MVTMCIIYLTTEISGFVFGLYFALPWFTETMSAVSQNITNELNVLMEMIYVLEEAT